MNVIFLLTSMIREERNEGVTIVSKWSEILEKYQ